MLSGSSALEATRSYWGSAASGWACWRRFLASWRASRSRRAPFNGASGRTASTSSPRSTSTACAWPGTRAEEKEPHVQDGRLGLPIPHVVRQIVPLRVRQRIGAAYADRIEPALGRLRLFPYDIRQTIVITGSPRSGTTWLAELLGTIPRSAMLWEPLFPDADPELRRIGFAERTYIPPHCEQPAMEAYLRRALTGRALNRWTLQRTNLLDVYRVRRWIVKFVRANMLLPWLVRRFPVHRPLLLIRHPCA